MKKVVLSVVLGLTLWGGGVFAQNFPVSVPNLATNDNLKSLGSKIETLKKEQVAADAAVKSASKKGSKTKMEGLKKILDGAKKKLGPLKLNGSKEELKKLQGEQKALLKVKKIKTRIDELKNKENGLFASLSKNQKEELKKLQGDLKKAEEIDKNIEAINAYQKANDAYKANPLYKALVKQTEVFGQLNAAEYNRDVLQRMLDALKNSGSFNVSKNLSVGGEGELTLRSTDENTNILSRIIRLLAQVLGTVAVLLYIVAAYFLITSQGDENQIQKGKTIVLFTTLGLVLAFLSYTLIQFVISIIFGIK